MRRLPKAAVMGLRKQSRVLSKGEFESRLEPGDVLVTTYNAAPKWYSRMFKSLAPTVTGSYGHTAIYAGDGKAVEVVAGKEGTRLIGLDNMMSRVNIKAFRPNAGPEERAAAAEKARGMLGTPYRGLGVLETAAEAIAPGFLRRIRGVRDPKDRALLCTELIDNAYGNRFSKKERVPLAVDFMDPEASAYVGQVRAADPGQWKSPKRARFGRSRRSPQGSDLRTPQSVRKFYGGA